MRNKLGINDQTKYSNLKGHLYKLILTNLTQGKAVHDPVFQVRNFISEAQILYDKCLYRQSMIRLEKAHTKSKQIDELLMTLEIVNFKRRLLAKLSKTHYSEDIQALVKESDDLAIRIHSLKDLSNLNTRLYSFYVNIGFIRNHSDFEIVNSFFYSSMPTFKEEDLSYSERVYLYSCFVGYYFFIQDNLKAYSYARKWVALFEESEMLKVVQTERYIRTINNLLIAQNRLQKLDEFNETLPLLAALPQELIITKNLAYILFKYQSTHQLNYHFLTATYREGSKLIDGIAEEIDTFAHQLDVHHKFIFYYKFACMHFGNEEYQKSVVWLNKIIHSSEKGARSDVQGFARILNLISHFELDNHDLVEYYLLSTYRYLIKRQDGFQFQKFIIKFLREMTRIDRSQLDSAFERLRGQMLVLKDNPYEKRPFNYFDIISWLESKITGAKVATIIANKVKEQQEREL